MEELRAAGIVFGVSVLGFLAIYIRMATEKRKKRLAKLAEEEATATQNKSPRALAMSNHAIERTKMLESRISSTPVVNVDALRAEMRGAAEEEARRLFREREAGEAQAKQLSAWQVTNRIDTWAHQIRSELKTYVRSEIQQALTDSGSGVRPTEPRGPSPSISDERNVNINISSPTSPPSNAKPRRR